MLLLEPKCVTEIETGNSTDYGAYKVTPATLFLFMMLVHVPNRVCSGAELLLLRLRRIPHESVVK